MGRGRPDPSPSAPTCLIRGSARAGVEHRGSKLGSVVNVRLGRASCIAAVINDLVVDQSKRVLDSSHSETRDRRDPECQSAHSSMSFGDARDRKD